MRTVNGTSAWLMDHGRWKAGSQSFEERTEDVPVEVAEKHGEDLGARVPAELYGIQISSNIEGSFLAIKSPLKSLRFGTVVDVGD